MFRSLAPLVVFAASVPGLLVGAEQMAGGQPQPSSRKDRQRDPLPPGALVRLGTVRFRQGSHLLPVAFLPDGKTLVAGSPDNRICFLDAGSGDVIRRFRPLEPGFAFLALSPDGRTLAAGTDSDTRTLPDGRVMPVKERILRLYDVRSGEQVRQFQTGNARPAGAVFSPDGRVLAVRGWFDPITLWDVRTGKKVREFKQRGECSALAFSPDGKTLAAANSRPAWQAGPHWAALWDVATGRLLGETAGAGGDIESLAFSPDGKRLAIGQNKTRLINVATRKDVGEARGGLSVFSPRGELLATGGLDGDIVLGDPATGKEIRRLRGHRLNAVVSLAFSPDGKTLASTAVDRTIRLWDVATGKETRPFTGHENAVIAVRYASDGRTLTTESRDGTIRQWDAATGRHLRRMPGEPSATSLSVHSPDGRVLATANQSESIRLWETVMGRSLHKLRGHHGPITALAFSPDGRALASGSRHTELGRDIAELRLWDVATGQERWAILDLRGEPASLAFTPDGRTLAVALRGDLVRLFEAATGEERTHFSDESTALTLLAFTPDGRALAAAEAGGTLRFWSPATGEDLGRFAGHHGQVNAVAFAPDGRSLASASDDTTVLVWDLTVVRQGRPAPPSSALPRTLWADLAGDGARAYRAVCWLAANPALGVPFLRERMRPAPPVELARLIAELDSEQFAVRERTRGQLETLDPVIEPALRRALSNRPPLEVRRSLERVLEQLQGPVRSTEVLRGLRGVEALEHIGTREARRLLEQLGSGAPEARLTQEARSALRRLARGAPSCPMGQGVSSSWR